MVGAVAKGAISIGKKLVVRAETFQKGISRGISSSSGRVQRVGRKISEFQKGINQENKKQDKMEVKEQRDKERDGREALVEAKKVVGPIGSLVNNVIKKPLAALWQFVLAWAVMNLPAIIKAVRVFIKKIRVFMGSVNKAIRAAGGVFQSAIRIVGAFVQNLKEFDFKDQSGRIKKAREEMDEEIEKMGDAFDDMKNVWGKEEEELDRILEEMDAEKDAREIADEVQVEAQETPTGGPPSPTPTGGSTRSGAVGALLDTISYAEGTPSYGTIYGGAVVPELEAGDLTIAEVLKMQKTGKVRGRDAGYKKDGYNSNATGRYQFMDYVLEEEAEKQGIPLNTKFTPALQDQMILARMARMRGVTEAKVEKEGLSADVIDRLAPEFASFPNLMGPDSKGRDIQGTSFYGQGGKSQEQLTQNFEQNLGTNTDTEDSTTAPPGATMPEMESNTGATPGDYTLVDKVPFKDFSRSRAEGGTGSIGKTDGYGKVRADGRIHKGVDIGTTRAKGIGVALKVSGRVTYVGAPDGLRRGAGRMIIIADGKKPSREYVFMHMEKIFLKNGQAYKAGTVIGEIGDTGGSQGEHLHFEVRINNSHIDPTPFLKLLSIGRISKQQVNPKLTSNASEKSQDVATIAASRRTNEGGQSRTKERVTVISQETYIKQTA